MANSLPVELPPTVDPALAWLFPGQGSQQVGMAKDVWAQSRAGRSVLETADRVLGYKLSEICFEGPEEKLQDTYYSQPAIVAVSLACLVAAVEAGRVTHRPAFMAGHSLGEYAALVVAGALSLADGLWLVQERSRLMADASATNPGTLAAVVGLDEATVERICAEADIDVCNRNLPGQTVIGGPHAAVAVAIEKAKAAGAQRAIELKVSGAFHSRLMAPANPRFADAVARTSFTTPTIPVVGNLSAAPLTSVEAIRDELTRQITNPVRWHESAMYIGAAGVTAFVEFGPGRVLTGFLRRLAPEASLMNISGVSEPAMDRRTVRA